LAEWPEIDRQRWQAAVAKGDLLLEDGPGVRLRPATLDRHCRSYGRWLGWLQRHGRLDPAQPPGARATAEAVAAYVAELQALTASQSVLVRLQSLAVVLRWLDPETERPWLRRVLARLHAMARPVRDKRARLQSADDLEALGRRMMREAEAAVDLPAGDRARHYRDGLLIAFLACRPLRLKNLLAMQIGRHLHRQGDGWWIDIPTEETKTRRLILLPFPDALVPALERYLAIWRPHLASPDRVAGSSALWLTKEGGPMSDTLAHCRITRHTEAAFGRPVNPHLFRDAAATTVALTCPEQIGIVTPLLGHTSIATAQRHYNLARATEATQAWHRVLDDMSSK
jgi:integrase